MEHSSLSARLEGSGRGDRYVVTAAGDGLDRMNEKNQKRRTEDMPNAAEVEDARLRQQAIGIKLRSLFDEVVKEPVPDEFLDILKRADDRRGGKA